MNRSHILAIIATLTIMAAFMAPSFSNETDMGIQLQFEVLPKTSHIIIDNAGSTEISLTNVIALEENEPIEPTETKYCSFWEESSGTDNNYTCKGSQDCCAFFEVGEMTPQGKYESGSALKRTISMNNYDESIMSMRIRLGYYEGSKAGLSDWTNVIVIEKQGIAPLEEPAITIVSPIAGESIAGSVEYVFMVNHTINSECSVFINDNIYALHPSNAPSSTIKGTIINDMLIQQNNLRILCKDNNNASSQKDVSFNKRSAELLIESLGSGLGSKIRFTLSDPKDAADITIQYPPVQGFPSTVTFRIGYNTSNPSAIYVFEDTYRAGAYHIQTNITSGNDLIQQSSKTISIENTLGCQILSNANYHRGEAAEITVRASSGTEPYILSLNNNNKTGTQNDFTIIIQGNDKLVLEAKCHDFYANAKTASREIRILENVTFMIKDALNDSEITGTVSFHDSTITGSRPSFGAPRGNYAYSVSAAGYASQNGEVNVDAAKNITVKLTKDNFSALTIQPPSNDSKNILRGDENEYSFRFTLSHEDIMACSLAVSNDNTWYTTLATIGINRTVQLEYSIEKDKLNKEVIGEEFYVQVTCRKDSLMKKSDAYLIAISTTDSNEVEFQAMGARDDSKDIVLADIVDRVAQANVLIESYDPDVQAFLTAIGEKQRMSDAEREVRNARRDLHNLIYRQLSDQENNAEVQRLTSILTQVESQIILGVTISSKSETVTYPSATDIIQMAERYSSLPESHPLSTKIMDPRRFSANLEQLQKSMSVTTNIMQGDVEYETGKQQFTVVIKEYNIKNTTKDMIIIDDISGTSLKSLNANSLYAEALSFDDDRGMVFFKSPSTQGTYSYYTKESVHIQPDTAISSYLIDRKLLSERGGGATGFATAVGLPQFNLKSVGALIVLIIIVSAVYGLYSGRISLSLPTNSKPVANARMLRSALNDIERHSRNGDYEKAFLAYEESALIYRQLSQKQTEIFHPEMTLTYSTICSKDAMRISVQMGKALNDFSTIDSQDFIREERASRWSAPKRAYDVRGMAEMFKKNVEIVKHSYPDMQKLNSYKGILESVKEQVLDIKRSAHNRHVSEMALSSYDSLQEAISIIDRSSQSYKSSYDALKQQHSMIRSIAKENRGRIRR
jgi:hypothetical protein